MVSRSSPVGAFSRFHLENWRNFTSVDADLADRTFLVGPNASGKSNFLDVFRFLRDVAGVGGGIQSAVERRGGVSKLRSLAARRYSDIVIEVGVVLQEHEEWRYRLAFNQDNQQRAVVKRETVIGPDGLVHDRDATSETDAEERTQTWLEQVRANKDFRQIAEFFASVTYLHLVPQLIREPDRSVGRKNDPYGGDFLERLATTRENTRNARLRRIRDALRVAVPQLLELEMYRDTRGTPHLRGRYEHWRAQGAWQEETEFSDGTLRLMGLLWALQDGSGPVLLEEPELSLHPEVVRYIPQMVHSVTRQRRRQVILSSHSSELLLDEGIGVDEVFLLVPEGEGTRVRRADSYDDIVDLLDGGASLAEAILPHTRPKNARQLALFEW